MPVTTASVPTRERSHNKAMKQTFYTRCTDCHSSIHGTDVPSVHGRGTFVGR